MIEVFNIKWYLNKSNGYYSNCYIHKGKKIGRMLHRYTWEQFHGKIPKGKVVHHKDGCKVNNDINNLELINDRKHRKEHAKGNHNALDKHTQKVIRIDKSGNKKLYNSLKEAAIDITGRAENSSNISNACRGFRKTAHKYEWRYI